MQRVLFLLALCGSGFFVQSCSSRALMPVDVSVFNENFNPALGDINAPVVIEQYSDFTCSKCKQAAIQLRSLLERYPHDLKVVFYNYVREGDALAWSAARAANAAGTQGRFWDMHDMLFGNQHELSDERMLEIAKELDLNLFLFMDDLVHPKNEWLIRQDMEKGKARGLRGTPTLVINGTVIQGLQPESIVVNAIERELSKGRRGWPGGVSAIQ